LEEEGLRLTCALDAGFPQRLRALGDSCPAFLLVAGDESMLAEVDEGRGAAVGLDGLAGAVGPVVAVPSEGLRIAARDPEVRRRVHANQLCLISPYSPNLRATAATAAGAQRLIAALNGAGEQPSLFESSS
jgi:predicted Rossmann fold nucleotide-binding protein DprA/Smf involved in DNA uptake